MSIQSEISSNFLENSRLIHIASEVVIFSGLAFYVVSQNKKLSARVDELSEKLKESEEMYVKLEAVVQQLNGVISQMGQKLQQHDNGLNILSDRINSLAESGAPSGPSGSSVSAGGKDVSEMFKKGKVASKVKTARDSKQHVKPILKETPPVSRVSKIQFKKPIVEEESDDDKVVSKSHDELSDSDLDDEISQELAELEEVDDDSSLKKGR